VLPVPCDVRERAQLAALARAAVDPSRSEKVGAMAHVDTAIAKLPPAIGDRLAAMRHDRMQYDEPSRDPEGALDQPSEATGVAARIHGTGGPRP
jgi:hypothetical protein